MNFILKHCDLPLVKFSAAMGSTFAESSLYDTPLNRIMAEPAFTGHGNALFHFAD